MKQRFNFLFLSIIIFAMTGCGLDNYDEPESVLKGRITYEGQALGLKGTNGGIQLQLYQDGYAKYDPITVYAAQDGTFQASLFKGAYKLVTKDNNGPWVNSRDTTYIDVSGVTECNLEVTPFFTISNEAISLENGKVVASCDAAQIVTGKKIAQAMLLVSQTTFVDEVTNIARLNINNAPAGRIDFSLDVSANAKVTSAKTLFARIGIKTAGADQAVYSQIFRLK